MKHCRRHLTAKSVKRRLNKMFDFDLNIHHLWHPMRQFREDPIARQFRNLHCMRVLIPVVDHTHLHQITTPPPMPARDEMIAQINRCGNQGCSNQGCTQPIKLALTCVPVDPDSLPREVNIISIPEIAIPPV